MRFIPPVALFAAAFIFALPVMAEPPATTTQPAQDPLKGPTVTDRTPPKGKGQPGPFGPDSIEKKKAAGNKPTPPPSMADFLRAVNILQASSTPEAAKLTSEQDAKIKAAAAEFESSTKSYMDKNKAELDTLRAKLSPTDRNNLDQQLTRAGDGGQVHLSKKTGFGRKNGAGKGGQPDNATPATNDSATTPATAATRDETAKVRTRIVEIYSGRPKTQDAQSKILGLLSPEQLPLVDAELAKLDARHAPNAAHRRPGRVAPKVD